MEPAQIALAVKEEFPEDLIEVKEFRGQTGLVLKKDNIVKIARFLRDTPSLAFDYPKDLCGVDYMGMREPRFEVVYHLYSIKHDHLIRLNVQVSEEDPAMDSVTGVWYGVDWHERECYDLFGIIFRDHPDLRRILLPEDWEGHPLRKDYPVAGPQPEEEWRGFREVLEKAEEYKKYQWKS